MFETAFKSIVIAIIIAFVVGLIGTVAFSWTLNTSTYLSTLSTIFAIIVYVLPISKLSPILMIIVSSMLFRIIISIVQTIWNLLPISG